MEKMLDLGVFSTKKNFMLAILVVVVVGATVIWELKTATYGGDSAPAEHGKLAAEATQYPFEFTITLEKTSYKLGAPVEVKWTLINVGDENVTLYHSADLFDFVVYNESLCHVFNYKNVSGIYPVYYPLPPIYPGGNITKTGMWDQIYDSAKFVSPDMSHGIYYEKVSPGIYYITGVFISFTWFNGGAMETPPIEIIIS